LIDTYAKVTLNDKGQYDLSYSLKGVGRFRVNLFKQRGDYAAVFRLLNETPKQYTTLGIPNGFFSLTNRRRGLVLVVGPTGSGKSTTLASFMNYINETMPKHIVTLEDPIEYVHWHKKSLVNQREIGTDCADFAEGLRAALRQDPDVILVGEMRDLESIQTALQAAETGHLVCSTLHTLGAAETINRIIDMFPERMHTQVRSQLCAVLEGVLSQQLMPNADNTGYVVTYEIMYKNKEIKNFIRENNIDAINEYLKSDKAKKQGMCSMDDTIFDLFRKGKISKNTALDFAFDRKELNQRIATITQKR
jgi:twitching motility protein PilT